MFNTNGLTTTERFLLNYIEEHAAEIPKMSIVTLSDRSNVSTASIVRTMKKLGYDGFTSFKHDMKKQYQLSTQQDVFENLDDIDRNIQEVLIKNELEVRNTVRMLDNRRIEDAIQSISGASQVYLFARGLSELIAHEMEVKFHLIGRTCELYTDPNIIKTISKRITAQDVVVMISLNGQTAELLDAARTCRKNEVPIILLTANGTSPLAKLSDINFVGYKSDRSYFPEYEVRSRLPLQVISRILLDAYAIRKGNGAH